ncbi:cytochrome P450 3A56-like [Amblyomma americanum]
MGHEAWNVVGAVLLLAAALVVAWVLERRRKYGLFKRYGISGPEPSSLVFGHWLELRKDNIGVIEKWIRTYGKLVGFYCGDAPCVILTDLDAIKQCFVREAHRFRDRVPLVMNVEPLRSSLLGLKGDEWKAVRTILNSTFSSAKMKMISRIIEDCTDTTVHILDKKVGVIPGPVDISAMAQGLTMDCITKAVLAWECEFQQNPEDPFLKSLRNTLIARDVPIVSLAVAFPFVRKIAGWLLPYVSYGRFFVLVVDRVRRVIRLRKAREGCEKREQGHTVDMLHLMLDAQRKSREMIHGNHGFFMTDDHVVSNCFISLGGGFETTSLALALLIDELARNPREQDQLLEELSSAFPGVENSCEISYDKLQRLKRLDMVVSEGLRKYPPLVFFIARMCYQDVEVAGKVLPAGTRLIVPTWNIHRDPEMWLDPEVFDPERFCDDRKTERHSAAYIPFGLGPRECIGKKFALLELKMALAKLLLRYKFSLNKEKEPTVKFDVPLISINPVKNIVLQVKRRSNCT